MGRLIGRSGNSWRKANSYPSAATAVIPAFGQGLHGLIGIVYGLNLDTLGDKLSPAVKTLTLNETFQGGFFIGLMFLSLVLISIWRGRFWCRNICPPGAILGLISWFNLLFFSCEPLP